MSKDSNKENKLILKRTSAGMITYCFIVCKEIIIGLWEIVRNKKYYRRDIGK